MRAALLAVVLLAGCKKAEATDTKEACRRDGGTVVAPVPKCVEAITCAPAEKGWPLNTKGFQCFKSERCEPATWRCDFPAEGVPRQL